MSKVTPVVEVTSSKAWSDDMGEISGFGGSYEAGCRAMVLAGIKWIDEHPDADPHFRGYEGVYGILTEDNDDAKALTKAVMDAEFVFENGRKIRCGDEATGAMHHATMGHVLAYKRLGWDEYCKQLREREKDDE